MRQSSEIGKPPSELGELLRAWRDLRGKSQLELSLDSGVSQRHISFVESGRSAPSRARLTDIADALDIPLRERNSLLLAAGYAPIYSDAAWDAPQMLSINRALERMLKQHEPYPAVAMDRYWNVLTTNDAAPRFFNRFVDLDARPKPRNLLRLMFDPAGMRPFIANWDETAKGLLARVHREAVGRTIDERTKDLLAALAGYPAVKPDWSVSSPSEIMPVIPIVFMKDGERLSYFSMVTTVGTPQTVAAQEIRIESMFPADETTERRHVRLMEEAAALKRAAQH
jgi:transcriptional regulator with XRE-family HTH domain